MDFKSISDEMEHYGICSNDAYDDNRKELKQYKFEFIKMIKKYTQCNTKHAYCEVVAHIENVGVLELKLEDPWQDVEECVSDWD